jgi:hypothetical protein
VSISPIKSIEEEEEKNRINVETRWEDTEEMFGIKDDVEMLTVNDIEEGHQYWTKPFY